MSLEDILARDWAMLVGRDHGPLSLRMVMQPLMAGFLAIRAGLRDVRAGRGPFGWLIVTSPDHRAELLRTEWMDVGRLFLLAALLDAVYQLIVFQTIHVLQALTVASLLAFPSYFLLRGLTNRVARALGWSSDGGAP